jgi:copper chaperone CopZ
MATRTFDVPNISCHHCVNTIRRELQPLAGVTVLDARVDTKQVTLSYTDDNALAKALSTLEEIGYPAAN